MNRRLLIVEDDETILFLLRDYLALVGFEVDCACRKEEAQRLITRFPFDLILLDLGLTGQYGREGFELIRFIREHSPQCMVILMSANGTPETKQEGKRLGADWFFQKPVSLPLLRDKAKELLGEKL